MVGRGGGKNPSNRGNVIALGQLQTIIRSSRHNTYNTKEGGQLFGKGNLVFFYLSFRQIMRLLTFHVAH